MPNRINKSLSTFKTQIDAYIRNVVSKATRKAIDIILSPCCQLTITSATFTCTGAGVASLVLKLNEVFVFPTAGVAYLTEDGIVTNTTGTYDNNGNITFVGVTASGSQAIYGAIIFLNTNTDNNTGVFRKTTTITATPPTCS